MNNATVALRESHKWIGFKIPFPMIRSSIGMLYISAALPRYRSQNATKPIRTVISQNMGAWQALLHPRSRCGERAEGRKSRADH